jgi:hypothetical protein
MNPICRQDLTEAKPLLAPVCTTTQTLNIGTASPATAYDVYAYREGDGRLVKFDITSTGAGALILDLTEYDRFFNSSSVYQVWAVADGANLTAVVQLSSNNGWLLTFEPGVAPPTLQTVTAL